MSPECKLMCGITLITVPTIEFGGHFLLRMLSGRMPSLSLTPFQRSMFRAGHAHAGVIVILSLICQVLADEVWLPATATWLVRTGLPLAAILISGGFFAAAAGKGRETPNQFISILYVGVFLLAISTVTLGIGLL